MLIAPKVEAVIKNVLAILSYKQSNIMDATLVTDILKEALSKYSALRIFIGSKISENFVLKCQSSIAQSKALN